MQQYHACHIHSSATSGGLSASVLWSLMSQSCCIYGLHELNKPSLSPLSIEGSPGTIFCYYNATSNKHIIVVTNAVIWLVRRRYLFPMNTCKFHRMKHEAKLGCIHGYKEWRQKVQSSSPVEALYLSFSTQPQATHSKQHRACTFAMQLLEHAGGVRLELAELANAPKKRSRQMLSRHRRVSDVQTTVILIAIVDSHHF